jgi:hypothetical protein
LNVTVSRRDLIKISFLHLRGPGGSMKIEPLSRYFASFCCKSFVRSFPKDTLNPASEANVRQRCAFWARKAMIFFRRASERIAKSASALNRSSGP